MTTDKSVEEDPRLWSGASRLTAADFLPRAKNLGSIFFARPKFPSSSIRVTLLSVFMGFFGGGHIYLV